jgi:alkylresorcinol/alkylpyrone synthase
VAVPSLDARLIPRLGLRPDVKRLPIFGLGCVAGAVALGRLHD